MQGTQRGHRQGWPLVLPPACGPLLSHSFEGPALLQSIPESDVLHYRPHGVHVVGDLQGQCLRTVPFPTATLGAKGG